MKSCTLHGDIIKSNYIFNQQNKMKAKKIVTAIYVALLIVTFTYADFSKGNMIALMFEFLFAAGLIVLTATLLAVVQIKRNENKTRV